MAVSEEKTNKIKQSNILLYNYIRSINVKTVVNQDGSNSIFVVRLILHGLDVCGLPHTTLHLSTISDLYIIYVTNKDKKEGAKQKGHIFKYMVIIVFSISYGNASFTLCNP